MGKHLIIAGHGRRKNGSFDAGAIGKISRGEHRYVKEILFPAMKKYANSDFIFFDEYNVFSYGNLVSLARSYGKDTTVTEVHYDAFNGKAQGGHVIIHSNYLPDAMDLRLRDAINSMVGLRFNHKGYKGISGRSNLGNVNRARAGNINYRLIELGFGDNARDADIMVNQVDEYAQKLVAAISNKSVGTVKPSSKPAVSTEKDLNLSLDEVVTKTIAGGYGVQPQRENNIRNKTKFTYAEVQAGVNAKLSGGKHQIKTLTFDEVVNKVIDGEFGTGAERKRRIAAETNYSYDAVQGAVNARLIGTKAPSKPAGLSLAQVVDRTILGIYGSGAERKRRIPKETNFSYRQVQDGVNAKLAGKKVSVNVSSIARQVLRGIDDSGKKIPNGRSARAKHFNISSADMDRVQAEVNRQLR